MFIYKHKHLYMSHFLHFVMMEACVDLVFWLLWTVMLKAWPCRYLLGIMHSFHWGIHHAWDYWIIWWACFLSFKGIPILLSTESLQIWHLYQITLYQRFFKQAVRWQSKSKVEKLGLSKKNTFPEVRRKT